MPKRMSLRLLLSLVFGGLVLVSAGMVLAIVTVAAGDAAVGDAIDKGRQAQRVLSEAIGAEVREVERVARLRSRFPEAAGLPAGVKVDAELLALAPAARPEPAPTGAPEGWFLFDGRPVYRAEGAREIVALNLAIVARTMETYMQSGVAGVLVAQDRLLVRSRSGGRIDEASDAALAALFAVPMDPDDRIDDAPTLQRVERSDDEPVFLSSELLPTRGLDLRVGFATTPSTIGGALAQIAVAALVAFLFALVAVLAALFVAKRIAGGIGGVRNALHDIAALDLDDVAIPRPMPSRELEDIRQALVTAVRSLRAFSLFVPTALVRRLLDHGDGSLRLAERRDVTVLFTDIVGFTTLAASMRPEEVTGLLDRYFGLITAIVEEEGGTVDKFIGDGVLAYWGAPEPMPDHAERGLRAARRIEAAQREAWDGPRLRLRIGVHSGPVVAGTVGTRNRLDYTVVGDTVNVASRLEQLGREVDPDCSCCALASAATIDASGDGIGWSSLGPRRLRGRDAPIEVFRIA